MTLRDFESLSAIAPAYHYDAKGATGNYIVWAEDGQSDSVAGNDQTHVQVLTGTIDYFTRTEYDANVQAIQAALNVLGVGWALNSVQHEDDTHYTHYEWVWEALIDG